MPATAQWRYMLGHGSSGQGSCDERGVSVPRGSVERTFGSADSSNAATSTAKKQQPGLRDDRVASSVPQQKHGAHLDEPSSVPLTPDIDELEQLRTRMLTYVQN